MPPIHIEDDLKEFGDHFLRCEPVPTSTNTVIFWDWDDTLLCSSFLIQKGFGIDTNHAPPAELEQQLRRLEASVISVLQRAMEFGEVYVVTNAEMGWVQLSAKKFMPALLPILQNLPVLSARSTFQNSFPNSPLKWKFCAFQQQLSPFMNNVHSYKNVLSFGDSHVEREAVKQATRGCPNTKTKVVKFYERPSILQLQHQIDLIYWCFQSIHDHEDDLDLALTIKEDEVASLPLDFAGFEPRECYGPNHHHHHNHHHHSKALDDLDDLPLSSDPHSLDDDDDDDDDDDRSLLLLVPPQNPNIYDDDDDDEDATDEKMGSEE